MTTFGTFNDPPLARGADIELAAADLRRQLSAIARLTEERDALLEACEDARSHLRLLVAEGILEYVNTEKLDAAIAKARGTRTR